MNQPIKKTQENQVETSWDEYLQAYYEKPSSFKTWSGFETKEIYSPGDKADDNYKKNIADAGSYPFTRGIHQNMFRGRLWTRREVVGIGSPADTHERLRLLFKNGGTGLNSIADVIVLNKADLDGAENCLRHLHTALTIAPKAEDLWVPPVVSTVSVAYKAENIRGIDELVEAIKEHQQYLHASRKIDSIKYERVEQELGFIFKDELQKLIFKGLKGTGKKKEYITSILEQKNDPYSVVDEVLTTHILKQGRNEK